MVTSKYMPIKHVLYFHDKMGFSQKRNSYVSSLVSAVRSRLRTNVLKAGNCCVHRSTLTSRAANDWK